MKTYSEAEKQRKEAQDRMVNSTVGTKEFKQAKTEFIRAIKVMKQFDSEIKDYWNGN